MTDDQHTRETGAYTTFWIYYEAECPEEGACFPFHDRAEAERHAAGSGEPGTEFVFEERDATDDEWVLIKHGMEAAAKLVCRGCADDLLVRDTGLLRSHLGFGPCAAVGIWRDLEAPKKVTEDND